MTEYQPSASIASSASHSSVTAGAEFRSLDRAPVDGTFDHLDLASVVAVAEIDLTDRTDQSDRAGDDTAEHEREILTWELFGRATRELATEIAADGFRPDVVLAIAAAVSPSPARSRMRSR